MINVCVFYVWYYIDNYVCKVHHHHYHHHPNNNIVIIKQLLLLNYYYYLYAHSISVWKKIVTY